jgi:tetratricopeptide (TPR) repeat protein
MLSELARRWPDDGELLLRLGESELARGRRDAALAAWERVPERSPFAPQAAALRAEQLINLGKYRAAETVLEATWLPSDRDDAHALLRARSRLYRFQGRVDEVREVLRASSLPIRLPR